MAEGKKNYTILEIGAGYGRTAHAILNTFKINKYFIIDLNTNLQLAKKYLNKILDKTKNIISQCKNILFIFAENMIK